MDVLYKKILPEPILGKYAYSKFLKTFIDREIKEEDRQLASKIAIYYLYDVWYCSEYILLSKISVLLEVLFSSALFKIVGNRDCNFEKKSALFS